jgi:hypothetical protein
MKKIACLTLIFTLIISPVSSFATNQDIFVVNSKITWIQNTTGSFSNISEPFSILVDDSGYGPCIGPNLRLSFAVENMPGQSQEALNRAAALSTMAFSMDLYVMIMGVDANDCKNGVSIRVSKTPFPY